MIHCTVYFVLNLRAVKKEFVTDGEQSGGVPHAMLIVKKFLKTILLVNSYFIYILLSSHVFQGIFTYTYTYIYICIYVYTHICTYIYIKGKAVLLQAWSGPEGSRKLRFPDFMTMAHDGSKIVSLTHRPPLPPRKYTWYSFLIETESTPGP